MSSATRWHRSRRKSRPFSVGSKIFSRFHREVHKFERVSRTRNAFHVRATCFTYAQRVSRTRNGLHVRATRFTWVQRALRGHGRALGHEARRVHAKAHRVGSGSLRAELEVRSLDSHARCRTPRNTPRTSRSETCPPGGTTGTPGGA